MTATVVESIEHLDFPHELTCETKEADDPTMLCGKPAVGIMVATCRHGHLDRDLICAECIELAQTNALECHECRAGIWPHECDLTFRIDPLP